MSAVDANQWQTGYSKIIAQDIASYLKRSFTPTESVLATDLIKSVEYEIASLCNRNFATDVVYFQVFNSGFSQCRVRNFPIASVEKIYIDTVDRTSRYTLGTHYFIYNDVLKFMTPVTGSGLPYNAIKIEYKIQKFWGEDITNLIKKMVAVAFLNSENGGVALSSMSFDSLNQSFNLARFEKEKESTLFRYTNFLI